MSNFFKKLGIFCSCSEPLSSIQEFPPLLLEVSKKTTYSSLQDLNTGICKNVETIKMVYYNCVDCNPGIYICAYCWNSLSYQSDP